MKEEIKTKAKFYLQQYAENLSDKIGDIKTFLCQQERNVAYHTKRKANPSIDKKDETDADWAIEYYQEKVADWKDKLEKNIKQVYANITRTIQ